MSTVSANYADHVFDVMPTGVEMKPAEVFKLVETGSPISVRHALRELCSDGRVTFTGEECRRKYRRVG